MCTLVYTGETQVIECRRKLVYMLAKRETPKTVFVLENVCVNRKVKVNV